MCNCIVDRDERNHAHEQGLLAQRDEYITGQVAVVLADEYLTQLYLDAATNNDWHPALTRLVMSIEKGQLDDDDYHNVHEEAVELIRTLIDKETK